MVLYLFRCAGWWSPEHQRGADPNLLSHGSQPSARVERVEGFLPSSSRDNEWCSAEMSVLLSSISSKPTTEMSREHRDRSRNRTQRADRVRSFEVMTVGIRCASIRASQSLLHRRGGCLLLDLPVARSAEFLRQPERGTARSSRLQHHGPLINNPFMTRKLDGESLLRCFRVIHHDSAHERFHSAKSRTPSEPPR